MNQADPQQAFEPKVIVEFEKGCGKPGGGGEDCQPVGQRDIWDEPFVQDGFNLQFDVQASCNA